MEIRGYYTADQNGYDVHARISQNELHVKLEKHVLHLVAERLADDLYKKHVEKVISQFSAKALTKLVYKKLENKMSVAINKLLKLEK